MPKNGKSIFPFISIVLPVLNNAKELNANLQILQQQICNKEAEILVIDNGSDDQSTEVAEKFRVKLLKETSFKSPYLCRNRGIKQAKGDIIILLDAKCIPSKNLIKEGIKAMKQQNAAIIAGNIQFTFSKNKTLGEIADALAFFPNHRSVKLGFGVPTGILFIKKQVFSEIGYFMEDTISGADIEWSKRATNAGLKLAYAENAIVYYAACNLKRLIFKAWRDGLGYYDISVETFGKLSLMWKLNLYIYLFPPRPFKLKKRIETDFEGDEKMLTNWSVLWLMLWAYKLITFFSIIFHVLKPKVSSFVKIK